MKRFVGLLIVALFIGSYAQAGIRPVPRVKEFPRSRALHGYMVNPCAELEGYHWAVYRPTLHRLEPRFGPNDLPIGPVWVAKRILPMGSRLGQYPYDLFLPNGHLTYAGKADAVFWDEKNPPPPVEFYWADRIAPDWFLAKNYDLFYPIADGEWWARSSAGKWDVISAGKLDSENGKGPAIETPEIRFVHQRRFTNGK